MNAWRRLATARVLGRLPGRAVRARICVSRLTLPLSLATLAAITAAAGIDARAGDPARSAAPAIDGSPDATPPGAARFDDRSRAAEADGWSARIDQRAGVVQPSGQDATPASPAPAPAAVAPGAVASDVAAHDITTMDDASLYERALGALEAGRAEQGQHLLEQLVARAPASALAEEARRRLAQIYAGRYQAAASAGGAEPAGSVAPPAAPAAEPSPAPDAGVRHADLASPSAAAPREGAAGTGDAAAPAAAVVVIGDEPAPWRERARRSHRFESMLSAEVGDRVFFGLSSSDIGTRARTVLERQARWIARYRDLYVVIEGHADDPGDDAANRALSLERADKARQLLIAAGLAAERVDVDPRGRQDRLADCVTAQCQAQNRRVLTRLMVVLPTGGRGDRSGAGEKDDAEAPRLATGGTPLQPGPRGDR